MRRLTVLSARLLPPARRLAAAAARNARGLVAFAALLAVAVGLWWERPSLALIVPGTFVLAVMSWTYCRGGYGR